jgi:hypothetical protein
LIVQSHVEFMPDSHMSHVITVIFNCRICPLPVIEVVEEDSSQAACLLPVLDHEVLVTPLLELGVEGRVVPGGVEGRGAGGGGGGQGWHSLLSQGPANTDHSTLIFS